MILLLKNSCNTQTKNTEYTVCGIFLQLKNENVYNIVGWVRYKQQAQCKCKCVCARERDKLCMNACMSVFVAHWVCQSYSVNVA